MSIFAGTALYQPPTCDRCEKLESECQCPPVIDVPEPLPAEKQTAQVMLEKRKKGKIVTLVKGLAEGTPEPHLTELQKKLKNQCGTGGSVKKGVIELQGDHVDSVKSKLNELGYKIK